MRRKLQFLIVLATAMMMLGAVNAAQTQPETFGDKVKNFLGNLNPFKSKPPKQPPPKKKSRPSPKPTTPASGAETEGVAPTPAETPVPKPTPAPNATLSPDEIFDWEHDSAEVRRIIETALDLTKSNLDYRYGSADPLSGGMDCSGFIYYVLTKAGVRDVPRDARDQYVWVRRAGNFQAVLAQSDETFELSALQPGDLLFWAANQPRSREPAVIETMIYAGRERATNQRIMVGATEDRTYKGQPRRGVSVVDFKLQPVEPNPGEQSSRVFVGYGRVPNISRP